MSVDLVLFNPGPYHPGQIVEGKVICVFSSSIDIRGIRLKLKGEEHTGWEEHESYTDETTKETKWTTVHYTGDNRFLEFQENVLGQGTQNPGRYEYPYRFILPRNLPGTYTSPNGGYVRYSVKATVDIPMAYDYEDVKVFVVQSVLDLNENQRLPLAPIQLQDEKTICCWCCADGPITMDVYLERGAFALGEIMKIKVDLENNANESVEQLKVELKNTIEERVNSPSSDTKYSEVTLATIVETGVGAHGNRTYNIDLRIPSDADLPNFDTCTLFKQYCEIQVEAKLPGPHTNMKLEQKVILGHIPPRSIGAPPVDMVPTYPAMPSPNQPGYPTGPGWVNPIPTNSPYPPGNPTAPSAPTKADLAAGFDTSDGTNNAGSPNELPPPAYNDIVRQ